MPRIKKLMKGAAIKTQDDGFDQAADQAQLDYEAYLKAERERKLREAALRSALTEKLEQMQLLDRLNRMKVQDNWRRIMRQAKLEDLKKEIEILSQLHEREIDRKDMMIAMLAREVDLCDEQRDISMRGYLQSVDEMLDLQRTRIQALQQEYEDGVEALRREFHDERDMMLTNHARDTKEIQEMIAQMSYGHLLAEQEAKQEFSTMRDEIRGKASDEYNALRGQLEGIIEDLEHHFENAHAQYMRQNDQRQETFKMMMLKDEDATRTLRTQQARIFRLQENIQYIKTSLQSNSRDWEERNSNLRKEKEAVHRHFQELKARLKVSHSEQHKRLIHLSVVSERTLKVLEEKLKKAERLLRLIDLNQKMETEREKVLPGYEQTVQDDENAAEEPFMMAVEQLRSWHADALTKDGAYVEQRTYLDEFFKRFNKCQVEVHALQHDKDMLEKENSDLRTILKQYLDGITVTEDVLAFDNPLLIVNQRSNAVIPQPPTPQRPVVQEAATIVRQR